MTSDPANSADAEHVTNGNETTAGGIVHRCSCGWISRPCFSNATATLEGIAHREVEAAAAFEKLMRR